MTISIGKLYFRTVEFYDTTDDSRVEIIRDYDSEIITVY